MGQLLRLQRIHILRTMMDVSVIVLKYKVGAGVGGTAVAARLAHAGLDVEVYEKNDFSGGRCSLIHHDGYRFDQVSQQYSRLRYT